MTIIDMGLAQRLEAATEATTEEHLAEIVNPLLANRDQLLALRNELKGGIAKIDERIVVVDRVLKAAGHTRGKRKTSSATTAPKPSPVAIEKAVRFLASSEKSLMTQEVAAALSVDPGSVQKQLKAARDLELVRVTGRGGNTGRALLYGVMPNAIERIEAGDVKWP